MGICLSYLTSSNPSEESGEILGPQDNLIYIDVPPTPTITPQTPVVKWMNSRIYVC